ncbi:hypothetical protein BM1_08407 [Bipolaris maydis]|nr:hypothetical protein BM1_08407 [Bipolaris maydis]
MPHRGLCDFNNNYVEAFEPGKLRLSTIISTRTFLINCAPYCRLFNDVCDSRHEKAASVPRAEKVWFLANP